jgi:hypothetical protein
MQKMGPDMSKKFNRLEADHLRLIGASHIFFVASAAAEGRVNVSPKGRDSLRVLGPNRILWRNLTGSGNETAGHLRRVNRITLMWCSFDARPLVLRAYGQARVATPVDPDWDGLNAAFPPDRGARQIFDVAVDLVQTSCGFAVPFMDFTGERDTLQRWAEARDGAQMRAYWREKNARTIDGYATGIEAQAE